jgi:hypothetical protein
MPMRATVAALFIASSAVAQSKTQLVAPAKPVAVITGPTANGGTLRISAGPSLFTAEKSASTPPGRPLTYLWTFSDDGSSAITATASHSFTKAGESSVTLVVADGSTRSDPFVIRMVVQPPPPPASTQQSSAPSTLPPRPPGVSIQAHDPLEMGASFRGIKTYWSFTHIGIGGVDRAITLGEQSQIDFSFWGPGSNAELPKGAYSAGVIVETNGALFDGVIQIILNNNRADDPVLKECPINAPSVTCTGYAVLSASTSRMIRVQLKRRAGGSGSYNSPVVRKILFDNPL